MCKACDRDRAGSEDREVCRRLRSKVRPYWERPVGWFTEEAARIRRENARRVDPEPLPYWGAPIKPLPLWTAREVLAELARHSRRLARHTTLDS